MTGGGKRSASEANPAKPRQTNNPRFAAQQAEEHAILELASKSWNTPSFHAELMRKLYSEIQAKPFPRHKVSALEISRYLENFLWPHFTEDDSDHVHVMSIVYMANEKALEGQFPIKFLAQEADRFSLLMDKILAISTNHDVDNLAEQTAVLQFLIGCFQSLELEVVRDILQPCYSLLSWHGIDANLREAQFQKSPRLGKGWKKLNKKLNALPQEKEAKLAKHLFLFHLIQRFFHVLATVETEAKASDRAAIKYCERFLELVTDIEALLITRRYLNTVIRACNIVSVCRLSPLSGDASRGHLFNKLTDMLKFYVGFEINDFSGEPLTDSDMTQRHYKAMHEVQLLVFRKFAEEMQEFAFANISSIDTRDALMKRLEALSDERLRELCADLHIGQPQQRQQDEGGEEVVFSVEMPRGHLTEFLCDTFERRISQLDELNESPLFPTEEELWDDTIMPIDTRREDCLALPKLNLQFLTLFDYLLRNLKLFNMESLYEVRLDLEEHLPRLQPYQNEAGVICFGGWSRMAIPLQTFVIVEVGPPHVGDEHPSSVRADVTITMDYQSHIQKEWENMREHDVGFLVSLRPPSEDELREMGGTDASVTQKLGVLMVRGCEVEGMLDRDGQLIEDRPDARPRMPEHNKRMYRVKLDPVQYKRDLENPSFPDVDVYDTFNVFIRRDPKENNFKAVLDTIRSLMNTHCVVPEWLHDTFLGYGDPAQAHYENLSSRMASLNFRDTFLDSAHAKESFGDSYDVLIEGKDAETEGKRLAYHVSFPVAGPQSKMDALVPRNVTRKKKRASGGNDGVMDEGGDEEEGNATKKEPVLVNVIDEATVGPYPTDVPKRNKLRFTPSQVEAIHSGMQPGLTLIVGPPGTGKTDVAVQIISNLYHNNPDQRTLIVTHSNQALNQLFEKIMELNIDERHLLRLGRGEELLETTKDFSRYGRVSYVLSHRLELLEKVKKLAMTLEDVGEEVASTCETSNHFFTETVVPIWKKFENKIERGDRSPLSVSENFPFHGFFSDAQELFKQESFDADMAMAKGCMNNIEDIFSVLRDYRPFEQVYRGRDRAKYLLTKEAKIVAMTCTHAAISRNDLVRLGFKYDNVIMEEAAQILEVETFIPLMLQTTDDGYNRLKRAILIGDHHQLPPVIKNTALKTYSNLEQSLFTRFVRLGVPHTLLDKQGRMRPSLADLFRWNYEKLGDLPHINDDARFALANPGFNYEYQLIDVGDFQGVGESIPSPHFVQNLAEAEYAAALFMYMRLVGYPASSITVLTTYNGQKALIRDVIRARCASHPLFGSPHKIETVDKFQGSQNDYIILSLVRTAQIGFIRDVRRLIVAMSRARLGLYVLARASLFSTCKELEPVFSRLLERPTSLHLLPNEKYGTVARKVNEISDKSVVVDSMTHLAQSVFSMASFKVKEIEEQQEKEEQQLQQEQQELQNPPMDTDTNSEPATKQAKTQSEHEIEVGDEESKETQE
eukprot:m.68179 g.68179  ORF g.68179 m.68179 type:complete len:1471 (-) comp8237_c0_seq1:466-4878(-)